MAPKTRSQSRRDSASEFDKTKPSLFVNLPYEIRQEIYKYALISPTPIGPRKPHHIPAPGLVGVNREIRKEALLVLYRCNEFEYGALCDGLIPTHLRALVKKVLWDYNHDELFTRLAARARALRGDFWHFNWVKECLKPFGFLNIRTVRMDEFVAEV